MIHALRKLTAAVVFIVAMPMAGFAQQATRIAVNPSRMGPEFQGLGAGAIFYEAHITSLAAGNKTERQELLYDHMFEDVNTRYLQLMIRHDHEPANDNNDPFTPAFEEKHFAYCAHTLAIAKAALKRQPDMEFLATLYTPPPWMKTNGDVSGGGESRATIKDGMDLELAEFAWAFLDHMRNNGVTVNYLAICNEPDWPHEQPGYCLTAERHAELLENVGGYLEKMAAKFPKTPRPKLAGPNTLSAPGAAKDYVPQALRKAGKRLDVIASHDYDPRGSRWTDLAKLARGKPVWMTEWCSRDKDASPGMIDSAMNYGMAMHHAFSSGGVNAWMAYDWVYPPRDSGEALIHIHWGDHFVLTKPYHLFRQWSLKLEPGMRVVDVRASGAGVPGASAKEDEPGVYATGFVSPDGKTLIVHALNSQDKAAPVSLKLGAPFTGTTTAKRNRTSSSEDVIELPELKRNGASFEDTAPAKSLVTYRFTR
ncbi:MAG TPA: glycoside hydrolase [Verrucomicrobiales bacterium]|nr:glycoside hydrolase [Verrucomicrobiales bacterium]